MLTTTQSYVQYQGNGVTTVFPYNFPIPAAGDLVVSVTDNNVSPAVSTVLQATQYSVTGIGSPAGGNVTYLTLPSGWTITIQRIVAFQQNTSLTNQGALYPAVVEGALDYLTMAMQQLAAGLSSTGPILPVFLSSMQTLTPNSATPSVASLAPIYRSANTLSTTITSFAGLTPGYAFAIIFGDANTTISFGAGIKGRGGSSTWTPQVGDILYCVSDGSFVYTIDSGLYASLVANTAAQIAAFAPSGLWTPSLTFGGASVGMTYSSRGGSYQVLGKVCVCAFALSLSAKGTSTGTAVITGLPVAAMGYGGVGGNIVTSDANFTGLTGPVMLDTTYGTTTATIGDPGATGLGGLTDSFFTNTTYLGSTFMYFIA
ncbi:MAG: hypothetical protein ABSE08_13400 [Syntrophobacteraceae bacterium]|jgi:hypothetical protein